MTPRRSLALLLVGAVLATLPATSVAGAGPSPAARPAAADPADPTLAVAPIGRYETGLGEENAEIVAFGDDRMFVTNSSDNSLDVVDVSDPAAPALVTRIDLAPYGAGPNSVDVHGGLVAVAVEADPATDPGSVVIFDLDGEFQRRLTVGALPDMLTFTPDGRRIVVANEGEPSDDYSVDPVGTISVIDTRSWRVRTAGFERFDRRARSLERQGVRLFGPDASVSQDLEPEYVAVDPDGRTAYVTLQENNAVATVRLLGGFPVVTRVSALGTADHSVEGNGIDASDRDGAVNIATWPVEGMYQPDAISAFTVGRRTYLVTANEGDARDYDTFSEEERVKDLDLDPSLAGLDGDADLGRLTVSTVGADPDGDGDVDRLRAFGSRSFSIWRANDLRQVYDSGDELERITAATFPANFNAGNDDDGFDNRSDNKGPEPEAVATGVIDGRTYAFVGLERIGGIAVYDVTDPDEPVFVQYTNTRDFVGDDPDLGPEGIEFVPADQSPTGSALLLVSHEITSTVVVYEAVDPDGAGTLSLLHNNDGESALLPVTNRVGDANLPVGGVAHFATLTDQQIVDARGDGASVVNLYAGDAFLASATLACTLSLGQPVYDAIAQRQIPYDAHILGNHEFDYSPDFLEQFIRAFEVNGLLTQPFLSANLDFSGEAGFVDLVDGDGLRTAYSLDGRVVAQGAVVVDEVTGARYGVVGATTPLLPTISSPRNVAVTPDLPTTAAAVQAVIDRFQDELGITKIVFTSHLQDLDTDIELVGLLRGVDLAVGGGGDELLANDPAELLPGDDPDDIAGPYPLPVSDVDGRTVYLVTTPGNYTYLGRLDVEFDAAGEVVGVDGALRRVIPPSAVATSLGLTDTVPADPDIESSVTTPVAACLDQLEALPVAEVPDGLTLDVSRDSVRGGESNAGNSVADSFLAAYDTYGANVGLPARDATVVAIQNGGGIRQNAGDALPNNADPANRVISQLDTINVLPFDNRVAVVPGVTPAELEAILDRSASEIGGGAFLQIAGLTVTYDESDGVVLEAALADGTDLITGGAPVTGAPSVTIVTNDFTAGGGDGYATLAGKSSVRLRDGVGAQITYEQAWREYLASFPVGAGGQPELPVDRYGPGAPVRITILP